MTGSMATSRDLAIATMRRPSRCCRAGKGDVAELIGDSDQKWRRLWRNSKEVAQDRVRPVLLGCRGGSENLSVWRYAQGGRS